LSVRPVNPIARRAGAAVVQPHRGRADRRTNDAFPSCALTPDEFKTWFNDGNVTKDGLVKPADSVAFNPITACSFYKWSEQMFLWEAAS
jgi:hypothetical protein